MTVVSKPAQTLSNPQWALNTNAVVVQSDERGAYFVVRPGDTASTIAASLKKQGFAIPAELEEFYKPRTDDPNRRHETVILRAGKRFELPKATEAQGRTYDGWLRASATSVPETRTGFEPASATLPSAPVPAAVVAAPAPSVGTGTLASLAPKFTALVEGAPAIPLGQLQKVLADELAALPPGTNREAVVATVDAYLKAHHTNMNNGSERSKDFYQYQLSWVAHAWATDPAVLNDRNALWENATRATNKAMPD